MTIHEALPPALIFRNLTLGYDRHPAVHHLSGSVASGSLLAVVGPNGAGKSTFLKSIVGVLAPLEGTIDRVQLQAQDIAYLPQSAEIDRNFPITVYDLVAMGRWRKIGMFGRLAAKTKDQSGDQVAEAIDAVGLRGFETRTLATLSGGQMQRVLFARLLLQDARVILLDEPFTAIDAKTTSDLLELIARWHREKRTVITVLHDMGLVREHFPETLLLAREAVAWGRTGETLSADNLLRARRMVEAFLSHADICDKVA